MARRRGRTPIGNMLGAPPSPPPLPARMLSVSTDGGETVSFDERCFKQGAMKDVHWGENRDYVVAFYREKLDFNARERLRSIVGPYRDGIFSREGGDFWKKHFCWPTQTLEHDGRVGIVVPTYDRAFFFEHGSVNDDFLNIKGAEKEGKWFSSASNRFGFLQASERGNFLGYLQIALSIARAVRRLHAAGLAHSDLSYKNVLVDPLSGRACIIDIDGLVVPGKFPPDVVGTPDFIAPEVVATQHLNKADSARKLPSTATDKHALAVLIYMYLFCRHPLKGGKVHDPDPQRDSELEMGAGALYVEHPSDRSNRVKTDDLSKRSLPWGDPDQVPARIAGPHLDALFDRAFVEGLHAPEKRPNASEWEDALVRTSDLLQRCVGADCTMGWYPFDNKASPRCPFCGTPAKGAVPVLNLYSKRGRDYKSDNHRIMVWDGQSLFPWHASRSVYPNERLTPDQQKRVGYFQEHQGHWYLVNAGLPGLRDLNKGVDVPIGGNIKLANDVKILLDPNEGGRAIHVQMAQGVT